MKAAPLVFVSLIVWPPAPFAACVLSFCAFAVQTG
jgi:hypothetical protein